MKNLLEKYENKRPEIVFEWKDSETEAEGWVVIHSLRGGAAGGGTRMRKGLDKREVESLAKTMEVKFTVSGPPIGGAKSGINFDPSDPRKAGVLQRWYKAVSPMLKQYYGTGGDLNVDEIHEVIPYTENVGIWHPQEGVLNGHFAPTESRRIHAIGRLRQGVSKILDDKRFTPDINSPYTVADMITGYGVAMSVLHHYELLGQDVKGKKTLVQGWGNFAAAAGYYLSKMGASIVGILDRNHGLVAPQGLSEEDVCKLFLQRKSNTLQAAGMVPAAEASEKLWCSGAQIFIPAAASRLVTMEQAGQLIEGGLELISCGANVPFADKEIFFGPVAAFVDKKVSVIPDFIANCGMARVFAYLMQEDAVLTDGAIFDDVSNTIHAALKKVHGTAKSPTGLSGIALELALKQLM
jgi:glutamate dehydrogenase/leucine dehydrogenase